MTPPDRIAPGQLWVSGPEPSPGSWMVFSDDRRWFVVAGRRVGTLWDVVMLEGGREGRFGSLGLVPEAHMREHWHYVGPCDWFVAELKKGAAVG